MLSVKNCKVSIVIPSFNKDNYISQTLTSIENQSYQDWEVIVVDDDSTDNSLAIVEEFCDRDMRFRLLRRDRKPKGASTCRNIGIQSARGEYLVLLDADDILSLDCLEDRVSEFENHKNLDFLVYHMGTFHRSIGDSSFVWRAKDGKHLHQFLSHDIPWTITSPIWRREFLLKLQGFDESFPRLQDVELHTRALLYMDVKYQISKSSTPDSYYRIGEDRIVGDYYSFIDKFIDGVKLYIESSIQHMLKLNRTSSIPHLKGTVVSAIVTILHAYKEGKISKKQKDDMLVKLLSKVEGYKLLSKLERILIDVYIRGYMLGIYHIKGYNYIFKKLVIYI